MRAAIRMSCRCVSRSSNATLYITIDEKPKRASARPLKRLRNMMDNPSVAFVADRYDEDWRQLGWVMLRGHAEILADGPEHDRAQVLLRERYAQYRAMQLAELPVIALAHRARDQLGKSRRLPAEVIACIIPADRRE